MNGLLLGIAAGAASALLLAAVTSGGALGTPLFLMSALPIGIVTLGWGTVAAIAAVGAGAVGLWFFVSWKAALLHAIVITAPMAIFAYLVGLGRPLDADGKTFEWYPLERVFTAMVLVTAASIIGVGVFVGFDVDGTAAEVADMLIALSRQAGDPSVPTRDDLMPAMLLYMRLMPFAVSLFWLVLTAANLWLAGRVVRMSGRLRRGDDRIAETLALPRWMIGVFLVAIPLSGLDGGIGLAASVVAGSAGMGFALVGLAVLHVYVRGNPAGSLILGATYATIFVLSIPLIPLALAGMMDGPFGLRAKRLNNRPGG